MAEMKWQEKINLDKLDEGTRDYLLALLLENRELKKNCRTGARELVILG